MIETTGSSMIQRMIRAARLDVSLYEEVENDRSALPQALAIVVLSSLATAIGVSEGGIGTAFTLVLLGVVGWALWAAITYFVGTRILGTPETHADWGQLARTLGFAQSVGVLRVFGIIPVLGWLVLFVVFFVQLAAMVIAVRSALDYASALRAVGVVLIGAIPYAILYSLMIVILT